MAAKSRPRSSSIAETAALVVFLAMATSGKATADRGDLESALMLAAADGMVADPSAEVELLLSVDVNRQRLDDTALVLRRTDGAVWVSRESILRWRLRLPEITPRSFRGADYYALDSLPGVVYTFDSPTQRLVITAAPEAFAPSTYTTGPRRYPAPTPPSFGGFANYEIFASHATGSTDVAGQFDVGIFGTAGVLVGGLLAQDTGPHRAIRLDTTFTRDFPERMETLRLGDAITTPGTWGRALRFGGVQFGSNFATQPGFVTFPTIAANGQAALPSTVDVFVNNALVAQRTVPPGPFSITNIPTISGGGNVQLVVHDLFGREQVISQPFYATSDLLKEGLSSYSAEAGVEREKFGSESAAYGSGLVAGTYRRGLSERLTGEARVDAARDRAAAGLAGTYLIDGLAVVQATAAQSRARDGATGTLVAAGVDRRSGFISFAVNSQWTSADFRSVGVSADAPLPRLQMSASLGLQTSELGSLGVTFVRQAFRSGQDLRVLSAGYSRAIGSLATLNIAAVKTYGVDGSLAVSAILSIPLGTRDSASIEQNVVRQSATSNRDDTTVTLQRSLPAGEGYGYRLLARNSSEVTGNLSLQNNYGALALDATRLEGATSVRADIAGGIGTLGGQVFFSRSITDSFGVVKVGDYEGVGVMQDNQPVARTNAGGYAVLPRLRAYDINTISIVQGELPLDAIVLRLSLEAVPFFRSGVFLDFPIRRSHGALLRLVYEDGTTLPPGATVLVGDGTVQFPVARDGEVYLTDLAPRNTLRATWGDRICTAEVAVPATRDPLPHLGTFTCRGDSR